MKVFKLIRANDWWEYKFPPILVMPYFIILKSNLDFQEAHISLLFILFALIIGAVYVSILNNMTDIEEDKLAGKTNRMGEYSKLTQITFLLLPSLIAVVLFWSMRRNLIVLLLCVLSFVSFTLYSLPPFRLKKRGIAGVIADAAGSQLFPTLFATTYIATQANYKLSVLEFTLVAIWSLCFGLRGILWHQFHDLENDVKSGLYTIVQNMNKTVTKVLGLFIIIVEFGAILGLLAVFGNYYYWFSLVPYFLYLVYYHKRNNVQIIILKNTKQYYCIFMNEYYQVILPVFILLILSFSKPEFFFLLFIHVLFFPFSTYRIFKNIST